MDGAHVNASLGGAADALLERGDDLAVARHGEDQRDVDRNALGQRVRDGRQGAVRRRDLDHEVGAVDLGPQLAGLGDGRGGIVRNARVDLDGHAAVLVARGLVNGREDVARSADVVDGERVDGLVYGRAFRLELGDVLVIGRALAHRRSEDGRVGGHADDVPLGDQPGQLTGGERFPGQVVQPHGDAGGTDPLQSVGHSQFPSLAAAEAAAIDSFAAATVASAVMPNWS